MRIWNCKDERIAMRLIPWFVPYKQDPMYMGWELHERLRENPNDTFCIVAIEKSIIQAILIAYVRKRDIWLWQAHTRKGFEYSKMIFNGLKIWSKLRKRKRIRMGVHEKRNAFQRRWGFKPCRWNKNIMEYIL